MSRLGKLVNRLFGGKQTEPLPDLDEDTEVALSRPDKAFRPGSEEVYSTIDEVAVKSEGLRNAALQARAEFLKFICESALGTQTTYEDIQDVFTEIDGLRERYGKDSVPVTRQEAASLYVRNSGMEYDFETSEHSLEPNSEELWAAVERASSLDYAYFESVLLPKRLKHLSFVCEIALSPPMLKSEGAMEILTEAQTLQEKYGGVKGYSVAELAGRYLKNGALAVVTDDVVSTEDLTQAIGVAVEIQERFRVPVGRYVAQALNTRIDPDPATRLGMQMWAEAKALAESGDPLRPYREATKGR